MNKSLSGHDYELFSAYLDGQLDQAAKTRLEAQLQADPSRRQALEDIAATRALLRGARRFRAPRNFTLSPDLARQARRRSIFSRLPAFSFSVAVSALSLLLALVFQVGSLLPAGAVQPVAMAPAAAEPMLEKAAPAPTQAAQPESTLAIQWEPGASTDSSNAAQPGLPAFGKGGGGGGGGGGGDGVVVPPSPLAGPVQLPAESIEGMKDSASSPAVEDQPTPDPAEAQRSAVSEQELNPILGVPAKEDAGKLITSSGELQEIPAQPAPEEQTGFDVDVPAPQPSWPSPAPVLLMVALTSAAAAFLIWLRSRR